MAVPPAEFEVWYGEAHGPLVRALVVIAGDVDTASDVVAEAFSRAFERWELIGSSTNPTGWTYRVALNLVRRHARRASIEARLLHGRSAGSPVNAEWTVTHESSRMPEVWSAVAALPRRQREAIALRYVADLSERQVADAMGVAEGTASATLAKARRHLAATLHHFEELRWT